MFGGWNLHAQVNTDDLQQGMENFTSGNYEEALEYLNRAVTRDKTLSPDMLCKAYYYRGLTYLRIHREVLAGDDQSRQKQYKDAILLSYKDFKSSLGYDNGTQWQQIDLEIKNLHHPLLQEGLISLNEYNHLAGKGIAANELLDRAGHYLLAAREIRETYLVSDLLGQVYLHKGMYSEAESYFLKSEKLYTDKLPAEPDFLMAYVFYRLAVIHKPENVRNSLQDIQRGVKLIESEHARFDTIRVKLSPERVGQMENQYRQAMRDLRDLKLDLYLDDNDLYVEAVHAFEQELSTSPDDTRLLTGYASLLEQTDREKAITVYLKILSLDPQQSIALFNLGALYYSKGKELLETAGKTADDQQYQILLNGATDNFKLSRDYFEMALAGDPGSLETVQALKTIAYILDDKEDYLRYQEMESRMKE